MIPKPVTLGAAAAAYWGRWFVCTLLHGLLVMLLLAAGTATAAPTTPTEDFTDNGDGTVTHRVTGLTWMRCAMGMTWTGTDCTGTASTYTWEQATALTANFAGKSDWRLPSIAELNTIVEREAYDPAINSEVFPGTPMSDNAPIFWSHSPAVGNSGYGWYLRFSDGFVYNYYRINEGIVRLMRGGPQSEQADATTPTIDFFDNLDGTVTHLKTGLMWKRCAEGQNWSGATCSGNALTFGWDTAIALTSSSSGHSDWRMPTALELLTLVEYNRLAPAVNEAVFPSTPSLFFLV